MTQRRTNEIIARKERETGLNERKARERRSGVKREIHRFGDRNSRHPSRRRTGLPPTRFPFILRRTYIYMYGYLTLILINAS